MTDAELEARFDEFDLDANGRIDESEFGRLLKALGVEFSPEQQLIAFTAIDVDGDGSIDFDEFRAWRQRT